MDLGQAIREIRANLKEIRKHYRLKRLRSFLRFLLIGFLIGKDSEKRISDLTERNRLLIRGVSEDFGELERFGKEIKEIADAYKSLVSVENELRVFGEQFSCAKDLVLETKMLLQEHSGLCVRLRKMIEQRQQDLAQTVENIQKSGTYLTYIEKERALDAAKSLDDDLNYCRESRVLEDAFFIEQRAELEKRLQMILNYNKDFVEHRKKDYAYLWRKELLTLDDEQQTAIVTDDKHNLVVAAAGSGKTEVLITRIAYLTTRSLDHVKPERILAIAYQRKAKEEIENRLHERYRIEKVNVKTFHKLGKDILESAGKRISRTDIIDDNKKHEIVKSLFEQRVRSDSSYYDLFLDYVKTLHDEEKEKESITEEDTLAYIRKHDYFAIDGTRVNSRAEKEIMDFLLTNKLNGQDIEVRSEPDVAGLFRPDFFLPQHDLFIEHWAINEKGEVPEWFQQTSEEYRRHMEAKKKWFAENKRALVETYTHEYNESKPEEFIERLKIRIVDKLHEKYGHCSFSPKTYEEIIELAWKSCKTPADDLVSYITTAKTYGLTPDKLSSRLESNKWSRKQTAFGNLAMPVYQAYEQQLRETGKIDFEDMINMATSSLENDRDLCADLYDQILVDEYQDISAQRLHH